MLTVIEKLKQMVGDDKKKQIQISSYEKKNHGDVIYRIGNTVNNIIIVWYNVRWWLYLL